ncbi:hypothetical protein PMIN01_09543 [Paraphaeosphaeria minitans]|uniref:Uncharacterized protein n=1 Tax=Paraphaeosphaeria minitans TaxID=565426 RepID=A0A9P6KN78_9PLEO|nr:hypothetical protein PMIN01_09543 [Paraphaeosphaeria minitans]
MLESYRPYLVPTYLPTYSITTTRAKHVGPTIASHRAVRPPTPPIFSPSSEAPTQSRLSLHDIGRCSMEIMHAGTCSRAADAWAWAMTGARAG